MTKKHKKENDFLDEIRHVPNISSACQKVGISRNTIYRWCSEDSSFKYRLDQAMSIGIDSVSDLAESKLIGLINISDFRAIAYWLDNNKKVYIKPRPKVYQDPDPFVPITYIEITPVDPLEDVFDKIDLDEIGMKEKIKDEVNRFKRFQIGVLGVKDSTSVGDVDIRNYAKYILRDGKDIEKRELLGCLKSKILLSDKKISIS